VLNVPNSFVVCCFILLTDGNNMRGGLGGVRFGTGQGMEPRGDGFANRAHRPRGVPREVAWGVAVQGVGVPREVAWGVRFRVCRPGKSAWKKSRGILVRVPLLYYRRGGEPPLLPFFFSFLSSPPFLSCPVHRVPQLYWVGG